MDTPTVIPQQRMSYSTQIRHAMGWLPDYPDFRDYTPETDKVSPLLKKAAAEAPTAAPPAKVDLRRWCSPIEDQEALGSCTANAGVGLLEYFERRAFAKHLDGSRLFLYKATRDLLHWTGDTGAFLRTTMGALALVGVPPEEYWPYNIAFFDYTPPPFCYAIAQNYQAVTYYRLDPPGTTELNAFRRIKANIAAALPSVFGFTVYDSMAQANTTGKIPFPHAGDQVVGGHAVMAVGYDDTMVIKHASPDAKPTKGALLIRNSWGTGWGNAGYGWMPYDYVLKRLAVDWWSLIKAEWVDTDQFKRSIRELGANTETPSTPSDAAPE